MVPEKDCVVSSPAESLLVPTATLADRHLGSHAEELREMLAVVQAESLDDLVAQAVPEAIRRSAALNLPPPAAEREALRRLRSIADKNRLTRSFIGMGYHSTATPFVLLRNVLENPGWYTQYTPYQAEIAQGRLEALLNFQTMVSDLTALPVANASLLDEATAAAEAMILCRAVSRGKSGRFFAASDCHPQTIGVLRTRARSLNVELEVGDPAGLDPGSGRFFAILLQYPTTDGRIPDYAELVGRAQRAGTLVVVATDLLALTLLRPPGEFGADVAIGSTQRFGLPIGYGGPHAAFLATRDAYRRHIPGRIVGVSRDAAGEQAFRLALQTREQHIRRERATSNICTAQVLLAIVASFYAVYHGPRGLRRIAERTRAWTAVLASGLRALGYETGPMLRFDTLRIELPMDTRKRVLKGAEEHSLSLREYDDGALGVSLDEVTTEGEVQTLLTIFGAAVNRHDLPSVASLAREVDLTLPAPFARTSTYLSHAVFNRYHTEHELLRYLNRLMARDLSLTTSMIPLGSCTMKLNATVEMIPLTWPQFADLHPYAPESHGLGYRQLFSDLERWLGEITGMDGVSLQPNSGAQGEYAGLLTIVSYHAENGQGQRNVCLIPSSAHGTNPASAVMAGLTVVPVQCTEQGEISLPDLREKAREHAAKLAAIMVTYPSTHGVFEDSIREVCQIVHAAGGLVYLDGANMNAQVGLCRPGDYGADVCHLNLHKTFAIPHGGGGPGMGPIAVKQPLIRHLPSHPLAPEGLSGPGPVSAAPFGSASILPISWVYIAAMGGSGLCRASQVAILNANYMATRLKDHYPVLFTGAKGRVAHEFVLDARAFRKLVDVDDIAKRLVDFGFHAPTMSWPVPGTLMIEPTESESKAELDAYCDALIAIREEIRAIERGDWDPLDNPLKRAPHTARDISREHWDHPYSRHYAAFPTERTRAHKYWPPVARIDNAAGDRHLVCQCPAVVPTE